MRFFIKNHPSYNTLLVLTALCIFTGVVLRVKDIQAHVFWHDEVHTMLRAFGSTTRELVSELFDGNVHTIDELQRYQKPDPEKTIQDTLHALASHPEHGPLYYFSVRFFAPFFDPPIAGARLLAAFISFLLFPAMYLLTRELFPNHKTAPLIALCLAALSPIHILYAREARQYSLYEVLLVISTFQFLKTCRLGRGWVLYTVLCVTGLYTHLMFGVLMLSHAFYFLIIGSCRSQWKNMLKSAGVCLVCFSPWLWIVLNGLTDVKNYTNWMKHPVPILSLLAGWADHPYHILFDLPNVLWLKWGSLVFVTGCLVYALIKSGRNASWMIALIIGLNFLPLMIPDIVSGGQRSMGARYVLPAMIFLQLCVVFFLSDVMEKRSFLKWAGHGVIVCLMVGTGFFAHRYFSTDTWWNRYCSIHNPVSARLINSGDKPLVLADTTTTNAGDVLSISYLVKPETLFLTQILGKPLEPIEGHSIFLLNPSWELQLQLRDRYNLFPVRKTGDSLWMKKDAIP